MRRRDPLESGQKQYHRHRLHHRSSACRGSTVMVTLQATTAAPRQKAPTCLRCYLCRNPPKKNTHTHVRTHTYTHAHTHKTRGVAVRHLQPAKTATRKRKKRTTETRAHPRHEGVQQPQRLVGLSERPARDKLLGDLSQPLLQPRVVPLCIVLILIIVAFGSSPSTTAAFGLLGLGLGLSTPAAGLAGGRWGCRAHGGSVRRSVTRPRDGVPSKERGGCTLDGWRLPRGALFQACAV